MRRYVPFLLILSLFACAATVGAADFWESKPYTQWSEKEARSIIEKSPWTVEFRQGRLGDIGRNVSASSGEGESAFDAEREFVTIVRVQLFSSRPVRQAYVAIQAKGDKGKLERMRDFATRAIDDEIIISWNIDSKPRGVQAVRVLNTKLNAMNLTDLKNNTYIATDTGKKLYIKDFIPPTKDGTGAKFVFPRVMPDGTPLITPDVKRLRFQTMRLSINDNPNSTASTVQEDTTVGFSEETITVDATFKVADMVFGGKLDY